MIDYVNEELFNEDSIQKNIVIVFSNGDVVTNTLIEAESMELTESLCSDQQLTYGACEASEFKVTIHNAFLSHVGQTMIVSMILDNDTAHPLTIGTYKVYSDNVTADRQKREIVAYDVLFDILNADVASWYNTLFPTNTTTKTLKQVRDSFFTHFGITQETVTLPNDSMVVAKTISPTTLSGKDVIKSICEINARFGHITRDNKFRYVDLKEMIPGLYPEDTLYPADDLYPRDEGGIEVVGENGDYISCEYEDFETTRIDKLVIRQEDTDIGCIVGTGTNAYIIQGNFLVFGKSASDLTTIANNIYSDFTKIWYRPSDIEIKGNPCIEVGDGLRLQTTYDVVYTYVLKRTLRGVQALRDTYYANGTELRLEQVNSVNSELIQLKGKQAIITKNVEEVSSELSDFETETVSNFRQTSEAIELRVTKSGLIDAINTDIGTGGKTIGSSVKLTANKIEVTSSGAIDINTTNLNLDNNGIEVKHNNVTYFRANASGAYFTGEISTDHFSATSAGVVSATGLQLFGDATLYGSITSTQGTHKAIIKDGIVTCDFIKFAENDFTTYLTKGSLALSDSSYSFNYANGMLTIGRTGYNNHTLVVSSVSGNEFVTAKNLRAEKNGTAYDLLDILVPSYDRVGSQYQYQFHVKGGIYDNYTTGYFGSGGTASCFISSSGSLSSLGSINYPWGDLRMTGSIYMNGTACSLQTATIDGQTIHYIGY